jgi:hypothetical protein
MKTLHAVAKSGPDGQLYGFTQNVDGSVSIAEYNVSQFEAGKIGLLKLHRSTTEPSFMTIEVIDREVNKRPPKTNQNGSLRNRVTFTGKEVKNEEETWPGSKYAAIAYGRGEKE